jgi:hypothetical protein
MTTHDDPTAQTSRRIKRVVSREIGGETSDGAQPDPDLTAAQAVDEFPESPGVVYVATAPARDGIPVIDPSRIARRRRKRSHVLRYRIAELATGFCFVGTIASVVCLVFGDRHLGQLAGGCAVLLGLVAIAFSWQTHLSSRVLGYATAATVVAGIAAGVALALPASLFEEASPDKLLKELPVPKRRF